MIIPIASNIPADHISGNEDPNYTNLFKLSIIKTVMIYTQY